MSSNYADLWHLRSLILASWKVGSEGVVNGFLERDSCDFYLPTGKLSSSAGLDSNGNFPALYFPTPPNGRGSLYFSILKYFILGLLIDFCFPDQTQTVAPYFIKSMSLSNVRSTINIFKTKKERLYKLTKLWYGIDCENILVSEKEIFECLKCVS